jgi:CBS domain-containing protein
MSPNTLGQLTIRETPLLRDEETVASAVRRVVESGLPALPVVDSEDKLVGIFGEREFFTALFPGYLRELSSAAFVRKAIDRDIDLRLSCGREPVREYTNTEHIDVGTDFSDAQVAEIFLHHRVLIIPVVDGGRVTGVITRSDFFRALVERFEEAAA